CIRDSPGGAKPVEPPLGHTVPSLRQFPRVEPQSPGVAAVRHQARGERVDYALEKFHLPGGEGGMGVVDKALHKPPGAVVAFKKPNSLREKLTARMLREIDVAQVLGDNRHVMQRLGLLEPWCSETGMPVSEGAGSWQHEPAPDQWRGIATLREDRDHLPGRTPHRGHLPLACPMIQTKRPRRRP
ncbi:hypothetical protein ACFT7S_38645, partial [Streptomyces sp. NPDC057136]